jgi:hypothetical protein
LRRTRSAVRLSSLAWNSSLLACHPAPSTPEPCNTSQCVQSDNTMKESSSCDVQAAYLRRSATGSLAKGAAAPSAGVVPMIEPLLLPDTSPLRTVGADGWKSGIRKMILPIKFTTGRTIGLHEHTRQHHSRSMVRTTTCTGNHDDEAGAPESLWQQSHKLEIASTVAK